MPQLPSGRHVAVDTSPLSELIRTWSLDASRHVLAGLASVEDLYPLTRILELVPTDSDELPVATVGKSLTPPGSMKVQDTGFRLSDCPDGLQAWSAQDREVFRIYRQTRVSEYLASQLKAAKAEEAEITQRFVQKLEAAWMEAGIHPSQESGWDDLPEVAQTDVFTQLIALLQCRCAISDASKEDFPRTVAVERLEGFLSMAAGSLPWLPKAASPMAATADLAQSLRIEVGQLAFPPEKRMWWEAQVRIECDNLFNDSSLEAYLKVHAPKAYGVVILAAISKTDSP